MSGAVVVRETGGPEALQWEDREVGDPGPGEIRLRQTAIGVNFVDIYQRTGLYKQDRPFVAGNEGVGVVTAVGEGVDGISEGDRVGYSGVPGAYAEERLLKAEKALPIPDEIEDETAAAALLKGTTAYYLLFLTWPVKSGETLLWHAAAGGVGLIACQWAKALGGRVIGTAGSFDKVTLARQNGCDHVINYRDEDFVGRVREITGGAGVDVVYDGVGQSTFEGSLDCLRPRGLMVSFGNASGPVSIPNLGVLAAKGSLYVTRPTSAAYFADPADLRTAAQALFSVISDGTVRVHIDRTFALRDAAEAHKALEGRQTTGSVVLLP